MPPEQSDDDRRPTSRTPARTPSVSIDAEERKISLEKPSLKEVVAKRVLDLFSLSLKGTLAFAGVLVLIDAVFIAVGLIKPDQRLMTERVIMTLIGATVVQVGAALAAIVVAVFRDASIASDD